MSCTALKVSQRVSFSDRVFVPPYPVDQHYPIADLKIAENQVQPDPSRPPRTLGAKKAIVISRWRVLQIWALVDFLHCLPIIILRHVCHHDIEEQSRIHRHSSSGRYCLVSSDSRCTSTVICSTSEPNRFLSSSTLFSSPLCAKFLDHGTVGSPDCHCYGRPTNSDAQRGLWKSWPNIRRGMLLSSHLTKYTRRTSLP